MLEPRPAPSKVRNVPLPIADLSNDHTEESREAYIAMHLNGSGSIVFSVSAAGFAVYDDAGRGFGEENFGLHFWRFSMTSAAGNDSVNGMGTRAK